MQKNAHSFSLYIHWPFCRKKCSYCDLNSHVRDSVKEEIWISGLESEMEFWSNIVPYYQIESIFFGGGTPSLIQPKNIQKLIKKAQKLWNIAKINAQDSQKINLEELCQSGNSNTINMNGINQDGNVGNAAGILEKLFYKSGNSKIINVNGINQGGNIGNTAEINFEELYQNGNTETINVNGINQGENISNTTGININEINQSGGIAKINVHGNIQNLEEVGMNQSVNMQGINEIYQNGAKKINVHGNIENSTIINGIKMENIGNIRQISMNGNLWEINLSEIAENGNAEEISISENIEKLIEQIKAKAKESVEKLIEKINVKESNQIDENEKKLTEQINAEIEKIKNCINVLYAIDQNAISSNLCTINSNSREGEIYEAPNELEITLETNPSSLESNSLEEFHKAGINRISFGVQSLNNDILQLLNRTHSAEEALEFIKKSLKIFKNVSVDIMYGLPTQTLSTLQSTLDQLLNIGLQHISIYELTLQKNTLLNHQIENNELFLPCDDSVSKSYELIMENCTKAGYKRYEISNFSKPNHECLHNQNYWNSKQFLGIGPGAHSRMFLSNDIITKISNQIEDDFTILEAQNIDNVKHKNYAQNHQDNQENKLHYTSFENIKVPEKWLKQVQNLQHGLKNLTKVSLSTQIQEFIMMGLRITKGIKISDFYDRFKLSIFDILEEEKINKLVEHNYISISSNQSVLKLTHEGMIRHGAICKYLIF